MELLCQSAHECERFGVATSWWQLPSFASWAEVWYGAVLHFLTGIRLSLCCPLCAHFPQDSNNEKKNRQRWNMFEPFWTCLKTGFCFPWASASASRSFGPNLCPTAAAKPPSCTSDCSGSLRTTGWTGAHFQRTFESFGRGNIAVDVVYGMESPSWSQLEINKT